MPMIFGNMLRILPKGGQVEDVAAIGASIRLARKKAGITQETLADLIGTSSRTIHAIETGTGNPSLGTVAAAAHAVGLHLRASTCAEVALGAKNRSMLN